MDIAFILPSLANKGPILLALELINFLIEEGHTCDVYYFADIKDLTPPCHTERISFFKKIDFNKYQIIHSHMLRPDLYCALYKSQVHKSTRVISTIHIAVRDDLRYTHGTVKSFLTIPFWIKAWKKMDHLVVLTNAAKTYYKNYNFKQLSVINNGRDIPDSYDPISAEDLAVIKNFKNDYLLLGCVCVLDQRKGLEQIIELLKLNKDYAATIIGEGNEKQNLEHFAKAQGVSDRFKILGARKDGFKYLPHFDLYIISSRSEGMPLALLEAMALKVPVVASAISAFTDEFKDDTLTYFNLDDIYSLNQACNTAVNDKTFKVDKAYQNYKKSLTVSCMANKYTSLYRSLLDNP